MQSKWQSWRWCLVECIKKIFETELICYPPPPRRDNFVIPLRQRVWYPKSDWWWCVKLCESGAAATGKERKGEEDQDSSFLKTRNTGYIVREITRIPLLKQIARVWRRLNTLNYYKLATGNLPLRLAFPTHPPKAIRETIETFTLEPVLGAWVLRSQLCQHKFARHHTQWVAHPAHKHESTVYIQALRATQHYPMWIAKYFSQNVLGSTCAIQPGEAQAFKRTSPWILSGVRTRWKEIKQTASEIKQTKE